MSNHAPIPTTPPGRSCAVKADVYGALIVPDQPKAVKTRPLSLSPSSNQQILSGRVTKQGSILKGPSSSAKKRGKSRVRFASLELKDLVIPPKVIERVATPMKPTYPKSYPMVTAFNPFPPTPRLKPTKPLASIAPHRCSALTEPCKICVREVANHLSNTNPAYETLLSDDMAVVRLAGRGWKTELRALVKGAKRRKKKT